MVTKARASTIQPDRKEAFAMKIGGGKKGKGSHRDSKVGMTTGRHRESGAGVFEKTREKKIRSKDFEKKGEREEQDLISAPDGVFTGWS